MIFFRLPLIADPSFRFFKTPSYTLILADFLPMLSAEKFLASTLFKVSDHDFFSLASITRSLSCTCRDPSFDVVVLLSLFVILKFEIFVITDEMDIRSLSGLLCRFFRMTLPPLPSQSILFKASGVLFSKENTGSFICNWSIDNFGKGRRLLSVFSSTRI